MYSVFEHLNGQAPSGVALKDLARKRKVIRHFTLQGESTIPAISDFLNISIPKTADVIGSLSEEGLVIDTGRKMDGPGRKAAIYGLNPASCYFLGAEIRKHKINIGLMGFDGSMAATAVDIPFSFGGTAESMTAVEEEIGRFLSGLQAPREKIIGLGLSLAGRINVKTSEILSIYHFGDAPVKSRLEAAFRMPVYLDNDSRTLAYGEYKLGRSGLPYAEKNVCIVNLDYGLAIGIFANGSVVYGASGYAGEIGHIPMFDNERICFCGKKGCLETEASGLALIRFIKDQLAAGASSSVLERAIANKRFLELEDILAAVSSGDELALRGVAEIGHNLGIGVAAVANMLNPELIVLGGALSALGEPLLLPVKEAVMQYSLGLVNSDTRIALSSMGQGQGLRSCCLLARDKAIGLV